MRRVRINVHTSKRLLLLSNNQYITLYNHSPVTPLRVRSVAVYILHTWCKYINKYLYPQHFLVFFLSFFTRRTPISRQNYRKTSKKTTISEEKPASFCEKLRQFSQQNTPQTLTSFWPTLLTGCKRRIYSKKDINNYVDKNVNN